jgi:ankyrin repeat protein
LTTTTLEDVQAFLLEHEHPSDVVNASHQDSTPLLQVVLEWCNVGADDDDEESSVLEDDDYYPKLLQVLIDANADVTATNQDEHSSVDLLCTAILQRYKRVKTLDDDSLVQSWKTAVSQLLRHQRLRQAAENSDDQHTIPPPPQTTVAQDAWLEIARRTYLDVAHLWWDDFQLSPVGVVNRQGMTPLQFAARSGHLEMVAFLLQIATTTDGNKNIMLEHQDQRGQTAQQAAETNHHPDVVRLLSSHCLEASGGSKQKDENEEKR